MRGYPQKNLEALYLMEIERQNLIPYSESPISVGSGNGSTATVVYQSNEVDWNGKKRVWKLTAISNYAARSWGYTDYNLSGNFTYRIRLKNVDSPQTKLLVYNYFGGTTGTYTVVITWSGAIPTITSGTGTITNLGNDWYEFVFTVSGINAGNTGLRLDLEVDLVTGTKSIFFADIQMVAGTTLPPYVPTTHKQLLYDYTGQGNDGVLGTADKSAINPVGEYLWLSGTTNNYISTPNNTGGTVYWDITHLDGTVTTGSTINKTISVGVGLRASIVDIKVYSDAEKTILIANLNIPRDAPGDVTQLYSKATGELWTISTTTSGVSSAPVFTSGGLLLNGVGQFATATIPGLDISGVTVSAHAKFDSTATANGYAVGLGGAGGDHSLLSARVNTNGWMDLFVRDTADTLSSTNVLSAYTQDVDSYITLRTNTTSTTLDLNGAEISTLTPPTAPFLYQRIVLGGASDSPASQSFKGTLGVAAVYSRELSATESYQTYSAAKDLLNKRGITLANTPPVNNIKAAATDLGVTLASGFEAWASSVWTAGMSWTVLSQPTTGIELDLRGNGACAAWWGDGNTDAYVLLNTSADTVLAHTYASAVTRPVVVLGDVTRWSGPASVLTSYGTKTQYLPASLALLNVQGSNTLSGDVQYLPANLTYLYVTGSNTLSGDVVGLPRGMTSFNLGGNNTITGDVVGLPTTLTVLNLGNNNLTGSIINLPRALITITVGGNIALSGDVKNLPTGVQIVVLNGPVAIISTTTILPTPLSDIKISNMTTASVDDVLEAMAANVLDTKPLSNRIITLNGGTAQPRSTASDAAVTTLTTATPPYTVTTIPPTNLITGSDLISDPVGTVGSSTVSHATETVTGLGSINVVTWVQATTADIISVTSNRTFNVTPGEALNISMYINSTLASSARLQAIVTVDTVDYYLQADGVTWSTTAWEWEPDVGTLNTWNRSVTVTNTIPAGTSASLHFLSMYRNTGSFTFKLAAWQVTEGTTLYPYTTTP